MQTRRRGWEKTEKLSAKECTFYQERKATFREVVVLVRSRASSDAAVETYAAVLFRRRLQEPKLNFLTIVAI